MSGADALAAVLFLQAVNETMQAYGTLNSSPWTAESFGADDRRAKAMREYVAHAVVFSMITGVIAAWIGTVGVNIYLVCLYMRASARGQAAGAEGWAVN